MPVGVPGTGYWTERGGGAGDAAPARGALTISSRRCRATARRGSTQEHDFRGNITDIDVVGRTVLPSAFKDQDVVVHLAIERRPQHEGALRIHRQLQRSGPLQRIPGGTALRGASASCSAARSIRWAASTANPPSRSCDIFAGEFERVQRPYPLLDETAPIRPSGYYGMSKAYGEAMGHYYYDTRGLSTIAGSGSACDAVQRRAHSSTAPLSRCG